eukprot:6663712-Pyramimonas_sp.AAC.2
MEGQRETREGLAEATRWLQEVSRLVLVIVSCIKCGYWCFAHPIGWRGITTGVGDSTVGSFKPVWSGQADGGAQTDDGGGRGKMVGARRMRLIS